MRLKRLKRKSKLKIWTRKIMISSTLFSTPILLTAHVVGGTEAMFVSEAGVTGEINSAFVFPATIEEIVNRMNEDKELIQSVLSDTDISNAEEGQILIEQINSLESIRESIRQDYQLIDKYNTEVIGKYSDEKVYHFVIEGYEKASAILDETERLYASKDLVIESIYLAIQELQQPPEEILTIEEPIPEEVIEEPIEVIEEVSAVDQPIEESVAEEEGMIEEQPITDVSIVVEEEPVEAVTVE